MAYRRIRSALSDVLGRFEISTTQWVMLGILYESAAGMRVTDIARYLNVETPLVTKLSRPLRIAGLIQHAPHKTDKRARPLALTIQGKHILEKINDKLQSRMKDLEKGVSSSDMRTYFTTLEALMGNATK